MCSSILYRKHISIFLCSPSFYLVHENSIVLSFFVCFSFLNIMMTKKIFEWIFIFQLFIYFLVKSYYNTWFSFCNLMTKHTFKRRKSSQRHFSLYSTILMYDRIRQKINFLGIYPWKNILYVFSLWGED